MNQGELSVKEQIILATINCIEKVGIDSITIRGIAKEAQVNVAAINYHFGSKQELLNETFRKTLDAAFSDSEAAKVLETDDQDFHVALKSYLIHILNGMFNYPGISKAHFYTPLMHGNCRSPAVRRLNTFLKSLFGRAKNLMPEEMVKEKKLSLVQIMAAIIFIGFVPDCFRDFTGINFRDPSERRKYVDHLLKHFLKKA
ncbi:MAG: TetR family transcriptional regulator [Gemmatimonadota bacterium]|nr:MAG: TetR family transcriptional regulator [Gemmatimonadota bacterium]